MINKREYKTPFAEITVFECADDIMTESRTLKTAPTDFAHETKTYISVGQKNWIDGLGN